MRIFHLLLIILSFSLTFQSFAQTPTPTPEKSPVYTIVGDSVNSSPSQTNNNIVNGKAINLVKPPYPPAAAAVGASGAVNVQVTIDENGNVISANAISGHALLRQAAESAARASKFSPTLISGQKVKVTGIIVYNFASNFKNSARPATPQLPAPPSILLKTIWFHRSRTLFYLAQGDSASIVVLSQSLIGSLPIEFATEKELLKDIWTKSRAEREKIVDDIFLLIQAKVNDSERWQIQLAKEIVALDTTIKNAIYIESYKFDKEELKQNLGRINELANLSADSSPVDLKEQFFKLSKISKEDNLGDNEQLIQMARASYQILIKMGAITE